jgi:serine/threonine-protein kinase
MGIPLVQPALPQGPLADDWTTFAHDQQRTAFQAQSIGLSANNVSQLSLRWTYAAHEGLYSSPVAYGGLVIIATFDTGTVTALDASTGAVVWKQVLGVQITATPTIADGSVFIGTHNYQTGVNGEFTPAPSKFYALNLLSGAIEWEISLNATNRSSSIVAGGIVYIGIAGGDPPTCYNGGIEALDEQTGALLWRWNVNPAADGGGAVWGPLAYDGQHILAGTGNTCNTPVMTANSVVALDPSTGALDWSLVAQKDSATDDDTGSGIMVSGAAYAMSKDGSLYSVSRSNGARLFSKQLNPTDQAGGWSTPATDGTSIVVGTGTYGPSATAARAHPYRISGVLATQRAAATAGTYGMLQALDYSGNVNWSIKMQNQITGYAALCDGVAIASVDDSVAALDLRTGATLWSYPTPALVLASPVIVPSGVYAADSAGNVYAFTIPGSSTPAVRRR